MQNLPFMRKNPLRALIRMLEQEGFQITAGLADIPTAFMAQYGSGKPMVGILGEYDALPSLSQKAGCKPPEELVPGGAGHGCGHNLLGRGSGRGCGSG